MSDNGKGMSYEDLKLAFLRHTTSKISSFEDLFRIRSYGFRGEALASISAISRLTCTSMPKNGGAGGKIIFHGGRLESHVDVRENSSLAEESGTSFFIRDLFYNTPARLKFLKSKLSEKGHIKRILHSYVLAHPRIRFSWKADNKDKEIFAKLADDDHFARISAVHYRGRAQREQFVEVSGEFEQHLLKGHIDPDRSSEGKSKFQYLFVNNRPVTDRQLHQIVIQAMSSRWEGYSGGGSYCLFLEIPQACLDINVHPHKTTVKFEKSSLVYSLLFSSIKRGLEKWARGQMDVNGSSAPAAFGELRGNLDKSQGSNGQMVVLPPPPTQESAGALLLSNKYVLYFSEGLPYLVDLCQCLELFCQKIFEQYFRDPLPEEHIVPLLIGPPFPMPGTDFDTEELFLFLKERGLELERLSGKTAILRSIPMGLDAYDYTAIINELFHFLAGAIQEGKGKQGEDPWRELMERFFLQHLPRGQDKASSLSNTKKMVETLGMDFLCKLSAAVVINDGICREIFAWSRSEKT